MGEAAGVATNSKGDIFVYTRTGHPTISLGTSRPFAHGGSRLFQFDKTGKFIREIGHDSYAMLVAQQVRVDPQDNVWIVDQMSSMVIKFDPNGQIALLLGRKSESETRAGQRHSDRSRPSAGGRGVDEAAVDLPARASRRTSFNGRPTWPGTPPETSILPMDSATPAIAKFDKHGKFIKSWGSRGTDPGQFSTPHGIAIDAQGNVYVADRETRRIQVFDGEGTFKRQIVNVGNPAAICITPGAHQYLYTSNSNPPDDIDVDGEIYKVELDGKILGKFGKAGKLPKEFGTVNAIDCRRRTISMWEKSETGESKN